ncbi:hypothetical protein [Anaeromyxobacter oryzisoli]|nr:hypothetical protein [Anaeromyxobacter sp. SG63]
MAANSLRLLHPRPTKRLASPEVPGGPTLVYEIELRSIEKR